MLKEQLFKLDQHFVLSGVLEELQASCRSPPDSYPPLSPGVPFLFANKDHRTARHLPLTLSPRLKRDSSVEKLDVCL